MSKMPSTLCLEGVCDISFVLFLSIYSTTRWKERKIVLRKTGLGFLPSEWKKGFFLEESGKKWKELEKTERYE